MRWAIAPLLGISVVLLAFRMGNGSTVLAISGTPMGRETTAPPGGPNTVRVDNARVAALIRKITASPRDTASLQALGGIYFAAADYKNASLFERKVLGIDPKNQVALLAIGSAQFHLGNTVEAKKQWLMTVALNPESAEGHYDLGFLSLSQTPPDTAKMTTEWNKVIAIDPNSAIAKTVATHLKSLTPTSSTK